MISTTMTFRGLAKLAAAGAASTSFSMQIGCSLVCGL